MLRFNIGMPREKSSERFHHRTHAGIHLLDSPRAAEAPFVFPVEYADAGLSVCGTVRGQIAYNYIMRRRDLNFSQALSLPELGRFFCRLRKKLQLFAIPLDLQFDSFAFAANDAPCHTVAHAAKLTHRLSIHFQDFVPRT